MRFRAPDKETVQQLAAKTNGDKRSTGPFSVLATVDETDNDDFLLFVASILNDKKKADVSKLFSDPTVDAIKGDQKE